MKNVVLARVGTHGHQGIYLDGKLAVEGVRLTAHQTLQALGVDVEYVSVTDVSQLQYSRLPDTLDKLMSVPSAKYCTIRNGSNLTVSVTTPLFYQIQNLLSRRRITWKRIDAGHMEVETKYLAFRSDILTRDIANDIGLNDDVEVCQIKISAELDERQMARPNLAGGDEVGGKPNGRITGWPDEWTDRHYNGIKEPCDMLSGPCCCGAWHYAEEPWVKEVLARHGVTIEDV